MAEGGTPPRFLIIDDGWQQIGSENKEDAGNAVVQEGALYVILAANAVSCLQCAVTSVDRWVAGSRAG